MTDNKNKPATHATAASAVAPKGPVVKFNLTGGLVQLIGVPVVYLCGFLLAQYTVNSRVGITYLLSPLMKLGLPMSKVPWAAIFIDYVMVVVTGMVANIFFAFLNATDNNHPRITHTSSAYQDTFAGRLHAAHLNTQENLGTFAAAVIIGYIAKIKGDLLPELAMLYLAARVAYIVLYTLNISLMRSIAYTASVSFIIMIFLHVLLTSPSNFIDTAYFLFSGPLAQIFGPIQTQLHALF